MTGLETGDHAIEINNYHLRIFFACNASYQDDGTVSPNEKDFMTEKDFAIFSKDMQTLFRTFPNIEDTSYVSDRSRNFYRVVEKNYVINDGRPELELYLL